MSFDSENNNNIFTKENLDDYLKQVSKVLRKSLGKNSHTEIILIGGAAILTNYEFRNSTTDVDAVIRATSNIREAVNKIGDENNLPFNWLNDDFINTNSFSDKLVEVSQYYKTFSNVLEVRTISSEYLIAMKLRSGRRYKNDLSDVVGILAEHQANGKPISKENIIKAVEKLYGNWETALPQSTRDFVNYIFSNENYNVIYMETRQSEIRSKQLLLSFEEEYPKTLTSENVDTILQNLISKKDEEKSFIKKPLVLGSRQETPENSNINKFQKSSTINSTKRTKR